MVHFLSPTVSQSDFNHSYKPGTILINKSAWKWCWKRASLFNLIIVYRENRSLFFLSLMLVFFYKMKGFREFLFLRLPGLRCKLHHFWFLLAITSDAQLQKLMLTFLSFSSSSPSSTWADCSVTTALMWVDSFLFPRRAVNTASLDSLAFKMATLTQNFVHIKSQKGNV